MALVGALLLSWAPGCASPAGPDRATLAVLTEADTDPAAGYERPPRSRAADVVPAELLRGPHHEVRDGVASDGFMRLYVVDSDFGVFHAPGDLELRFSVQHVLALQALRELRRTDAWLQAVDASEANRFVRRFDLVRVPVSTITGAPEEAWREVLAIDDMRAGQRKAWEVQERQDYLDFEDAKVALTARLGVSPYTHNATLQRELNRAAWVMVAGGLSLDRVADLGHGAVAPRLEDLIPSGRQGRAYDQASPEDLRRLARIELMVMGLPDPLIERFLTHPAYTPREQALLVESLVALDPLAGRGDVLEVALRASGPADPMFHLIVLQILRRHHEQIAPLERLVSLEGRRAAALTSTGKLIVPAQVDHLFWTRPVEDFAQALAGARLAGREGLAREVWLSGTASPKARSAMASLGIEVVENAIDRVFPRSAPDAPEGAVRESP